jgi:signal transduction histidine kinase
MAAMDLSMPVSIRRQSAHDAREFTRFYRWGWLPVAVGTFALCATTIMVWDFVARARGLEITTDMRMLFAARAFLVSALAAAWSGFFVHRTRRRIEKAREELIVERALLAEQRRRLEQTEGVAATLRVMAHEIRNPLNSVRLHANVIRRCLERHNLDAAKDSLGDLDTETVRLADLIDEYIELGRADALAVELRVIDVRAPIRDAVEAHRGSLERRGINVFLDLRDEALPVEAEPRKLAEIVHKLLRNASEAIHGPGRIEVRVRRDDAPAPMATIEVADSGPGFSDPTVAFRPFYSTKPEGTGLGLSIVHDLVRAHRGEVAALNGEAGGACVRIRIPLALPGSTRCSV